MRKWLFGYAVFISGYTIISFEVIGSRLLAPVVGTTAPVWGGLLATIIAASSIGYYIGGPLADKKTDVRYPALALTLATLAILIILPLRKEFVSFTPYGLAAMLMSIGYFFIPTVLLSLTTAFVTRLASQSLQALGRTSGGLYAVATIGGVAGIFSMSYILIPLISIPIITVGLAIAVGSAALALWLKSFGSERLNIRKGVD